MKIEPTNLRELIEEGISSTEISAKKVFSDLRVALREPMMTHPLYTLLTELESASIHFTINRYRPDTVLVTMTLVGERVEIDVFEDGHMEVSRFPGSEDIVGGEELVTRLIEENRD